MSKWNFWKKIGIFNALALTIAGCNSFNPSNNEAVGVYGPPEMFEEPADEDNLMQDETEEKDDSEEGKSDNSKSSIHEMFKPEENIIEDVYGPPEMFED